MTDIERNMEIFGDRIIKASYRNIGWAFQNLTAVEMRQWIDYCEMMPGFHPSHYAGMEDQFIRTGQWDWVPVHIDNK